MIELFKRMKGVDKTGAVGFFNRINSVQTRGHSLEDESFDSFKAEIFQSESG